jgi:4-amino-4-deoxy-L-arabinose transferase-like glycosyltransferase
MTDSSSSDAPRVTRLSGRLILVLILLLAGASRTAWLLDLRDHPATTTHGWEASDMHFFHHWAGLIAGGDWLTDRVLHPLTSPELLRLHLDGHPEERVRWSREAERDPWSETAEEALWNHWMGGKQFHQAPLYPYLLALAFLLFGPSILAVFALQCCLGVASIWLLHRVTARLFDEPAAHLAAALAALHAPFLHYEATLLRVPLLVFLCLLVTWLAGRALDSPTGGRWLLVGLAAGVAALAKPTLALIGAGLGLHLAWRVMAAARAAGPAALRRPGLRLAGLVAGVLIAISPLVVRNVIVGVRPLSTGSTGALTFITANGGDKHPARPGLSKHTTRILVESDGRFGAAAKATLSTHDGPGSLVKLLLRRLDVGLHWYERPNNTNYYHARAHSWLLPLLPVGFGLLGPLAVAGAVASWKRWSRDLPFLLLSLSLVVPMLALQQMHGRYRAAVLPILLPLAASAAVSLARWIARRRWAPATLLALALYALGAWSNRPLPGAHGLLVRPVDIEVSHELFFLPRVDEAETRSDPEERLAWLDRELAGFPAPVRALGVEGFAATPAIARCAAFAARLESERAATLRILGREVEAADAGRRAARLLQAAFPRDARPRPGPAN